MPDRMLVPRIKDHQPCETSEFFYGGAAPIFIKLYDAYYTDCMDIVEFINDFYTNLMEVRPSVNTRKIDGFAYECKFKNWIARIATVFCYQKYDATQKQQAAIADYSASIEPEMAENIANCDIKDVNTLLGMMPNQDYAKLIRLVYIDGMTLTEAATVLDVPMQRFFNMHRRAKLQYVQVYSKEFKL